MTDKQVVLLKGSCYCSDVHYESSELPFEISICHCIDCQKVSGAPFVGWAAFPKSALTWHGDMTQQKRSSIATRTFCNSCGTPFGMVYDCHPNTVSIALGTVDAGSIVGSLPKPGEHIFLQSKASWLSLPADDTLAKYDRFPPNFQDDLDRWRAK